MPTRTELVWDGKYDANGKRVAPLKLALPFQAVETVNEPAGERKTLWSMLEAEKPWRNRLVRGDKKYVLPSLLPEFAGTVNLIYIDPPFDTGADFSFTATVPEAPDDDGGEVVSFTKQPSVIEQKAYRDTWGRGIDSYLHWLSETVSLLHELLSESGSLYLHIEPDVGNYARAILDEVFGPDSLRTEIVWKRTSSHGNVSRNFGEIWESIFFYTKSAETWTWNQQHVPFDPDYIESHFTGRDPDGRKWTTSDLVNPGLRPNLRYDYKGYKPHRNGWKISRDKMEELDRQGRLYYPQDSTGRIRLKRYLDETPGQIAQNLWLDISPINSQAKESLGYATQKPEALLERVIRTSSNEGDLVLLTRRLSGLRDPVSAW
jgi:adenine-specific DNA-methyltransferase